MTPSTAPQTPTAFFLFTGLSETERDALIRAGKIRNFESGARVFLYGDTARSFYIVTEGAIQLFRETPDGHEMTNDVLIAGDTIGETEILQQQTTYQFNALAIKKSAVLEFPATWLKESAQRHPTLALNLLGILSRRAHIATVESEHRKTMTAPQQIACFLERLCILHDFNPAGFTLPYSKTLIASRLGMELETFSRALAKLREHGITVSGMQVSFDNLQKMENFVCGNCSIAGHCQEHEALKARSETK